MGTIGQLGYAGLPDSVEKFEHIIQSLRDLGQAVSYEGFKEENAAILEMVYGKWGTLAGLDLKVKYQSSQKRAKAQEPGEADETRQAFLSALKREIAAHERLRELCQARDWETTDAMKDAHLLPEAEDLKRVLRYEAGLERQFRRKLRQLLAWRRAKRAATARKSVEAIAVEAQ